MNTNTDTSGVNGAVSFIGAWLLVIVFAIGLAQTGWGRTLLYYFLWLAVILLIVSHGPEITSLLNSGGIATDTKS